MADLESSLTAMDWLHRLKVGGAMAGGGVAGTNGPADALAKAQNGQLAMRKAPNSPHDPTATWDVSQGPAKDGKPPYSYANLITFAINSSPKKKMTLAEIYQWICDNFPYYKDAGNGWKVNGTALYECWLWVRYFGHLEVKTIESAWRDCVCVSVRARVCVARIYPARVLIVKSSSVL